MGVKLPTGDKLDRNGMDKDIVLIEWVDSAGSIERWEFLDDIEPILPHVCYSVGYLFVDEEDYKTLISNASETQVMGRITIPTVCIKSIKVLKEKGGNDERED